MIEEGASVLWKDDRRGLRFGYVETVGDKIHVVSDDHKVSAGLYTNEKEKIFPVEQVLRDYEIDYLK